MAHAHPICRALELLDPPESPEMAPSMTNAVPLFVIDIGVAYHYESARPAVIVRDRRTVTPEAVPPAVSSFGTPFRRVRLTSESRRGMSDGESQVHLR
jgi:hypothetical protein